MTGGCRTVIRAGAKYLPNVPNPVGSSRQRPTRGAGGGGQCSGLAAQILFRSFYAKKVQSIEKLSQKKSETHAWARGGQCSGLAAQILSYPDFSSLQLESVIKGVAKAKKRPKRSQKT